MRARLIAACIDRGLDGCWRIEDLTPPPAMRPRSPPASHGKRDTVQRNRAEDTATNGEHRDTVDIGRLRPEKINSHVALPKPINPPTPLPCRAPSPRHTPHISVQTFHLQCPKFRVRSRSVSPETVRVKEWNRVVEAAHTLLHLPSSPVRIGSFLEFGSHLGGRDTSTGGGGEG